jgi:hypothetical protein
MDRSRPENGFRYCKEKTLSIRAAIKEFKIPQEKTLAMNKNKDLRKGGKF